jgi:hypothetical protein
MSHGATLDLDREMIRSRTELRAVLLMLQRRKRRVAERRKSLQLAGLKSREVEQVLQPLQADCFELEQEISKFKQSAKIARRR